MNKKQLVEPGVSVHAWSEFANSIAGVQPMSVVTGNIFTIRVKYRSEYDIQVERYNAAMKLLTNKR